jgi:hypothetical protein
VVNFGRFAKEFCCKKNIMFQIPVIGGKNRWKINLMLFNYQKLLQWPTI